MNPKEGLFTLPAPQTAQDVRKALGQVMSDLIARRLDARVASAMAYVGNVMLRAIEVADLEARMDKVEGLLQTTERQNGSKEGTPCERKNY